jgi:hypothetical protein
MLCYCSGCMKAETALPLANMPENTDFFINYKGSNVRVTAVINKGNIYFIVHFKTPVTVAEGMINEVWQWHEINKGETILAAELGEIIEKTDL